MRKFSSYGPVNTALHYYVPREALIAEGTRQLQGETGAGGGHYRPSRALRPSIGFGHHHTSSLCGNCRRRQPRQVRNRLCRS